MRDDAPTKATENAMPRYNIVHFQNPAADKETAFADWQRRELSAKILELPGVQALRHFGLQPVQLQPPAPQPYRLASLYELETDDLAGVLKTFTELARNPPKQAGLLAEDVAHVFELTRPLLESPHAYDPTAPLNVAFVMGNCIDGMEKEYDAWYDNVHSVEVLGTPGFFRMRRGVISPVQADPEDAQPANRLVLLFIRSHDLFASIEEFIARAFGTSKSGIAWGPREAAASFASLQRTTHVFTPYCPRLISETAKPVPASETEAQK
jgi:hypothetical protein